MVELPVLKETACRCEECCEGCQGVPGWFAPGQAELVAEHLGITLGELFRDKLVVEYWVGGMDGSEGDIHFLAPANHASIPGEKAPYSKPRARCMFLDNDGLCSIHPVKPRECAISMHDMDRTTYQAWREDNVRAWMPHQDQIEELLGAGREDG